MPNDQRFYSLRRPCADCPFRADSGGVELPRERAQELLTASLQGTPFYCHKTVDYSQEDEIGRQAEAIHCAGMTILLEKAGQPSLSMRLGAQLGLYDPALTKPNWGEVMDPSSILAR